MDDPKDKNHKGELPQERVIAEDDVVGDLDIEEVPERPEKEEDASISPELEGEQSESGSAPDYEDVEKDVEDMVENVIGNEPESGKPFSIADEVLKDELARRRGERKEEADKD